MRILHTSDWHLGKRLYKLDRLAEHQLFLRWILDYLRDQDIDHLLVAGDIFDVPQPPHRSLRMFYDFLAELCATTKTHAWIIGGNHDSGTLLEAPSSLVDMSRIHLCGALAQTPQEHWHKLGMVNGKSVDLCLLPYFRAHELHSWKKFWPSLMDDEQLMANILRLFLQESGPSAENSHAQILMGHHLFGLYEAAGSEQAIALSGVDTIPLNWCQRFIYLALGHIHKPQVISQNRPMAIYPGSPLPMRFSEANNKGVELIRFDEHGQMNRERIALPVWRLLQQKKTNLVEWKQVIQDIDNKQYPLATALELVLSLTEPKAGLADQIRTSCEERGIELLSLIPEFAIGQQEVPLKWETLELSPEELFKEFYHFKFPEAQEIPLQLFDDFRDLLNESQDSGGHP